MFEEDYKDIAYSMEIADLEKEIAQLKQENTKLKMEAMQGANWCGETLIIKKENEQLLKLFQVTNKQRRNLRRLSKSQSIAYDNIYINLNNLLYAIDQAEETDVLWHSVKKLREKYSMKEEYLFSR